MEYFDILNTACNDVGLNFDNDKYNKFMKYMQLIKEWNTKINLTAIVDDEAIVKKHFIDCIKIFKFNTIIKSKSIIDVGTGAGFPGIPISIFMEETEVLLLDSLNKRVNFLNEVISELNLKNISAVHGRAEDAAQNKKYREKFDISVSRAVANMSVLCEYCMPFVKEKGFFVAMKGPGVEEELSAAENAITTLGGRLMKTISVNIEDSDLKHNLVVISKIKRTPVNFPRKAGIISKKPI